MVDNGAGLSWYTPAGFVTGNCCRVDTVTGRISSRPRRPNYRCICRIYDSPLVTLDAKIQSYSHVQIALEDRASSASVVVKTSTLATPWLGFRHGYLSDWITQRWVQLTGHLIDPAQESWLAGPMGKPTGIGKNFFRELAEETDLEIDVSSPGQCAALGARYQPRHHQRHYPAS